MIAIYKGKCWVCRGPIWPGQEIVNTAGTGWIHEQCDAEPEDSPPAESSPCRVCFCYHAGQCA